MAGLLRTFPNYTISTLLDEDAQDLLWTSALLDLDLGKATDGE